MNPKRQTSGIAQALQVMTQGILEAMAASNQAVLQSNQQLVKAITAPRVITGPDGRQYTARSMVD